MKDKAFLILLLLLSLLLVGCGKTLTENAVGEVNGDKFSQKEFDQHYKLIKLNFEKQNTVNMNTDGTVAKDTPLQKIDEVKDKGLVQQLKNQSFDDMVLQKLLWQQAKKEGIEVTDDEIDADLKPQLESYQQFLKDNGLDDKIMRQELKTQKLYGRLQEVVTRNVTVSELDMKKYYDEHQNEFSQPGGVQISHILVETEKQANDILAQLKGGADFASLAKKYSTCPSKAQGGYLELGNENSDWVPEFKTAALKLKPGEMTLTPVKTKFGYHIIKAGEHKEAVTTPYNQQAKNQITLKLQDEKKSQAFSKYLKELKDKADIKDLRNKEEQNTKKDK